MFHFKSKKDKQKNPKGRVCAVIPAAGSSTRMGGQNKLLMEIDEVPVLVHTLSAFQNCSSIDEIIVCCREEEIVPYGNLCKTFGIDKVTKILQGGETRTRSVLNGVMECSPDTALVAIHDGARPLVTQEVITMAVEKARETGAAAPVVNLKDSIKRVADGIIRENIDRNSIVAVQTPQVFDKDLIKAALSKAVETNADFTDDCCAVEAIGMNVSITEGSYENIKITTPEDILIAEALLQGRKQD